MMRLMMRTTALLQTHSRTRHLLWLVLVALMGLQLLGVIHRQIHADSRIAGHASTTSEQAANAQLTSSLFAEHGALGELAASCQLFDLAASGIALTLTQPTLCPSRTFGIALHASSTVWIAALLSAYDARGPPALI